MRIKHCHISSGLRMFKPEFFKRWELQDYKGVHAPTLFVGMYVPEDLTRFNYHRGFKVVLFGGADIPNVKHLNKQGLNIVVDPYTHEYRKTFFTGLNKELITVPWKSYSQFVPVPLGDKFYSYQSQETERHHYKYRFDMVEQVARHFGWGRVSVGYHGNTMEEMQRDFYTPACFNLQFNPIAGFTTTLEMAHMGRMSISNYDALFCLNWQTVSDVIKHLETVRSDIHETAKAADALLHHSDNWLHKQYWA